MGPLIRRFPQSLRTEDHKLPFGQQGVVVDGIPLVQQSDLRRGVLEHPQITPDVLLPCLVVAHDRRSSVHREVGLGVNQAPMDRTNRSELSL